MILKLGIFWLTNTDPAVTDKQWIHLTHNALLFTFIYLPYTLVISDRTGFANSELCFGKCNLQNTAKSKGRNMCSFKRELLVGCK